MVPKLVTGDTTGYHYGNPQVVIMETYGTTSDVKVSIMTILSVQLYFAD